MNPREAGGNCRRPGVAAVVVLFATLWAAPSLAAQRKPPEPPPDSPLAPRPALAASRRDLFYGGERFGSEASIGVLDILVNRGLHYARAKNGSVNLRDIPGGRHSFFTALRSPVSSIEAGGGFKHWVGTQLVPMRLDRGSGWVSNYFGHVMEGGIAFRVVSEKLESAGVPHPWLWAAATEMGTSFLNETVEGIARNEAHSSHVADFYIFEPLGLIVFSNDAVARFFSEQLGARIWPHQTSVSITTGEVMNSGLDLAMKVHVLGSDRISPFARFGMGSSFGFTLHGSEGLDVSVGLGFDATRARLDDVSGDEIIDTVLSGSLFIDRDESLLVSVQGNAGDGRRFSVNFYPGSLEPITSDFGLWLVVTANRRVQFGISHLGSWGLGLGY